MRPFLIIAIAAVLFGCGWSKPSCSADATTSLRLEAEQGRAEAQFKLGRMYYEGASGIKQNYAEALKWFQKAADQKYTRAADYLGVMYQNGTGVTRDYAQALKWYREAAAEGSSFAPVFLGEFYENGIGGPQNYPEALSWYRKAAGQPDSARAQWHLGLMYSEGKGVAKDFAQAMQWQQKAAEHNYAPAQYSLGVLYAAQDYAEAVKWWLKAAKQGHLDAQLCLAAVYYEGKKGVPRNFSEAAGWYRVAAEQGNTMAQNKLSLMYFDGEGVARDYVLSYVWASFSAAQNDPKGIKILNHLEIIMSADQIAEAQRASRRWGGYAPIAAPAQ
jgi:TPR repeat protein